MTRSTTRLQLSTAAALLLATLTASNAWGHKGDVNGIYPLYTESGRLIGAAASIGLIRVDPDGLTLFEPHPTPILWAATAPGGRVITGGTFGARVTSDWGCAFAPIEGPLGETEAPAVVHVPGTTTLDILATADPKAPNALYRATHTTTKTTLTPIAPTRIEGRYTSLIRRTEDGVLLATSVAREGDAAPRVHLGDATGTWVTFELDLDPGSVPRLLGAFDGGDLILAIFTPDRPRPTSSVESILKSDGTETLFRFDVATGARTPIAPPADLVRWKHATFDAGEVGLLVTDAEDMLYQWDGQDLMEASRDPRACLFRDPIDGGLMACGEQPFPFMFYTTTNARGWKGIMPFERIAITECNDPTLTMTLKEALETDRLDPTVPLETCHKPKPKPKPNAKPSAEAEAPPPPEDATSPSAEEGGCGVATGVGIGWLGLMFMAGVWFLRR